MWKFIAGYALGILVALSVMLSAPAKAFEDPGVDWYVLTTVTVVPGQFGALIFNHASNTEAECKAWMETDEFNEQLAGIMSDLVKIHPKIKIISSECRQPPENAGGNPA